MEECGQRTRQRQRQRAKAEAEAEMPTELDAEKSVGDYSYLLQSFLIYSPLDDPIIVLFQTPPGLAIWDVDAQVSTSDSHYCCIDSGKLASWAPPNHYCGNASVQGQQ